ncbi:MAG: hypothetical protein A2268_06860 [Candidatus Raymondbacteria bacterium RifOxyA12_full_50_37]|nr:MAG: hypothetical protein A2268_06860 [Candidatus Raymondbacteria bacterium RifOxyA12_full_50_37]OGJ91107.1 MAG: hypothetical protein A2248_01015 [Candidatus Raymondbacteria bacterium RIFOXYA2_FULL_49_16]OGJ97504.1 MAG: hypothetical protein A2453_01775 [Candidatus Raymondbacteria bacterium RIFOXYC2_FULL_50_21]OGJ99603.1 MAG: hypothetical protein A2487_07795 [Candidatus Raymondbacteria bacterium RifOxyC12_full_50_8]OGP44333.1 MAG: hypothetical protein A2324_20510 [Candidatus Raymondbacteria b
MVFALTIAIGLSIVSTLYSLTVTPAEWVPASLASKIQTSPASLTDVQILSNIDTFQNRIAALNQSNTYVQKFTAQIRENVLHLYREYNLNHTRSAYGSMDFTAAECLGVVKSDLNFYLDRLQTGANPFYVPGRNMEKAYWNDYSGSLGQYTILTPNICLYATPNPLVISQQDDPGQRLQSEGYITLCRFKKDYQFDDNKLQVAIKAMILDAARDVHVDPFRVYTTGFSFGAQTCLRVTWRYQDWFAASVPVHNDLNPVNHAGIWSNLANLINTPTRLINGSGDNYYRDSTYRFMLENGCPVQEFMIAAGHNADIPFRDSLSLLVNFLDSNVLNPYPKRVKHNMEFVGYSRAFWVNGKVANASGTINTGFDVSVSGNTITITSADANIRGFDFYLSDSLLNMNQPVVVVHGSDTLYNSAPSAKISVTLTAGTYQSSNIERLLWEELDSIQYAIFGYRSQYNTTTVEDGQSFSGNAQGNGALAAAPNPFNPAVTITVSGCTAALNSGMSLIIYDLNGRLVANLTSKLVNGRVTWNAVNMPSGLYVVQSRIGKKSLIKAVTLLK